MSVRNPVYGFVTPKVLLFQTSLFTKVLSVSRKSYRWVGVFAVDTDTYTPSTLSRAPGVVYYLSLNGQCLCNTQGLFLLFPLGFQLIYIQSKILNFFIFKKNFIFSKFFIVPEKNSKFPFLNFQNFHFFNDIFWIFNFFVFSFMENPYRDIEGTNLGRLRRIRHGNGSKLRVREYDTWWRTFDMETSDSDEYWDRYYFPPDNSNAKHKLWIPDLLTTDPYDPTLPQDQSMRQHLYHTRFIENCRDWRTPYLTKIQFEFFQDIILQTHFRVIEPLYLRCSSRYELIIAYLSMNYQAWRDYWTTAHFRPSKLMVLVENWFSTVMNRMDSNHPLWIVDLFLTVHNSKTSLIEDSHIPLTEPFIIRDYSEENLGTDSLI